MRMMRPARLCRLMQTSTAGGSAESEHMALTVRPARPAGPSVVTTLTPEATRAIAEMNAVRCCSTLSLGGCCLCSLAVGRGSDGRTELALEHRHHLGAEPLERAQGPAPFHAAELHETAEVAGLHGAALGDDARGTVLRRADDDIVDDLLQRRLVLVGHGPELGAIEL